MGPRHDLVVGARTALAAQKGPTYRANMLNRTGVTCIVVLLAAFGLSSCKTAITHTKIDGTWKSPTFQGPALTKLFVVGVAQTQPNRELYEKVMAESIRGQGAEAEASFIAVGESKKLTKSQVREAIETGGFDGMTLTHVLSVEHRNAYHEGTTTYVPTSDFDLYMMSYDQRYEKVTQPGYYDTSAVYNIETIVYDAKTGDKIWWAVSETVDPDSVDESIHEVAAATAERMKAEGVIR